MSPEVLYRVTIPEAIKINDGYFQPHNPDSRYGNSIPMIHRYDLLTISRIFADPRELKARGIEYFVILAFRTSKLKNIIDVQKRTISFYREYFAIAPINALVSAMKFEWLPENSWKEKSFRKSVKYLGIYSITASSEGQ